VVKWRFLAALAIVGLNVPCDARAPGRATVVTSRALGIRVTKPAGWHTLTASQREDSLERMDMDPGLRALAINAGAPPIAFTKFAEPYNDANPSVEIRVRDAGKLAGESAAYILNAVLESMLAASNGDLVVNVRDATVGGRPAAYARINSRLRAGGKTYPTASEVWIVTRGREVIFIGAGTRVDQTNGTRAEVHRVVQSIRFTR